MLRAAEISETADTRVIEFRRSSLVPKISLAASVPGADDGAPFGAGLNPTGGPTGEDAEQSLPAEGQVTWGDIRHNTSTSSEQEASKKVSSLLTESFCGSLGSEGIIAWFLQIYALGEMAGQELWSVFCSTLTHCHQSHVTTV